nr:hypothetical protein [Tanacetum cinerariifolium]
LLLVPCCWERWKRVVGSVVEVVEWTGVEESGGKTVGGKKGLNAPVLAKLTGKRWLLLQELFRNLLEDFQFISDELAEYINSPSWNRPAFYNDDDKHSIQYKEYLENSFNAITPVLPTEEPEYSLGMGDEHLSTIPETESDEVIKSSVENLFPIPSGFEVTSNNENPYHVNVESDLIESLLNRDTLIDFSPRFDYPLEEFSSKLAHIDPIPSGIKEADFDLEEEICLVENLLMLSNDTLLLPENESSNFDHHDDLSFPRPPPEPPDVDIFFDFEPDTGVLTAIVVEDIFEHHVLTPNLLPTQPTLCLNIDTLFPFSSENEDKVLKPGILSYLLESHWDKTIYDFSKSSMMMYGGNIPHLDVLIAPDLEAFCARFLSKSSTRASNFSIWESDILDLID